ncbi:hypothetical protein RvY_14920 [Ramazzottius varieornatus]|uniref:Uncharacterized protein n=1 Tax=Ramazzottius varieornatus TaxID=947166 RepID=A0A1D1VT19_RAMVA|nr:hypothetical protein RvY_14920 [Ramazzottius varieornatus]
MAEVLRHHCREEFERIWPIQMYQPMEHLRCQAEQISRLESLVESLHEDKLELQKTVKALEVSRQSILGRLSLLENIAQRLPVPPYEPPASKASVASMTQATATATPVVSPLKAIITPTFAAVTARRSQPSGNPAVRQKATRVVVRGTKKADEESITANPLRAKRPPGRDFAIRSVPRHVTAEQLKDYLQNIGVKPRFRRIVPVGPDDTKSSMVGRIGVFANNVDVVPKAENWSSNISITPWKFGL